MGFISSLRGFADVEITGRRVERFANLCSERGIDFRKFERTEKEKARARLYWRDYKKLMKEDMSDAGLTIQRLGIFGTPAVANKMRGRRLLIGAIVLCGAALICASRFVWKIEVTGNETVSTGEILIALEEEGVTLGTRVSQIDSYALRNRMLLRVDGLIWFSVNMQGSTAHVEVRERKEKPQVVDMSRKTQVVAEKDGLITDMQVLSGVGKVQRGMTVAKGDVLITGEATDVRDETRYIYADGKVWARTWYTFSGEIPLACAGKAYTGEKTTIKTLMFGKNGVKMSLKSGIPFASCDKIIKIERINILEIVALPISIMTETYIEYDLYPQDIPRDEAEEVLTQSLYDQLTGQLDDGKVSAWTVNFSEENGILHGVLYAECEEQIGRLIDMELPTEETQQGKE